MPTRWKRCELLGDTDLPQTEGIEGPHQSPHDGRIRLTLSAMAAQIMPSWSEFCTVEPGYFLLHGGLASVVEAEGTDVGALTGLPVKQHGLIRPS